MSFSGEVKEELSRHFTHLRHCQLAEFAAILTYCGEVHVYSEDEIGLELCSENPCVLRKYFTLLKKTFNINTDVLEQVMGPLSNPGQASVEISDADQVEVILKAIRWMDVNGGRVTKGVTVNPMLLSSPEDRRAFLRGAYLAIGSMSDPEKGYHFEYVCTDAPKAEQICKVIEGFGIEAKIVLRKNHYVVYLKEGAAIVDLLNIMEAHVALMNFENLRIYKEMRNSVNRRVNCETANIAKTVSAANKQLEDIILVRDQYGFSNLPENLRQAAEVRLDYPDATLKELGEYMDPPVGKSGMNHRLRKLGEIAESLRSRE
ncbi:MAG: DNA-binding protein WhiA [Lachnospiraceae bacterium]|nr:DNA-binding protein WhiA [Lachnospiraceae bacterium]